MIDEKELVEPLKKVIRKATQKDLDVQKKLKEKEKFAVKCFDLEKSEYLLYTDCKTYFYNGVEYSVTDGCFTVPKPKEEPVVYQPNDAELAIMEMQADMYEQQEQSNLTLMESLADFYETMMGGNEK